VERGLLRGLAVFRWAAWIWMATVLVLARRALERPVPALVLVGLALVVTIVITVRLRGDPRRVAVPSLVGAEVGVAFALQLADGWVYRAPHVFQPEQPLGVGWPTAAILSAGLAFGPVAGIATGVLLGAGRAVSSTLAVVPAAGDLAFLGPLTAAQTLSLVTTTVLYAFAGGVAGYVTRVLRDAERRVADAERSLGEARARESLARRLHDGVLQTLALVERRTDDPALARLARDQERDLRDHLFSTSDERVIGRGTVGDALRATAARHESAHGGRVEVLVPDDVPPLGGARVEAVAGAVGEALTNAAKHGGAGRCVVSAEPVDDGVAVSVLDDGGGFDPDAVPEGIGRARSIRARIEELGGHATWRSRPGHGCEVRLWVPVDGGTPPPGTRAGGP
jgi:signal transduction histidine kinase